jgi:ribonuclease-3
VFKLFHNLLRKDRAFIQAITNVTSITPDNVYLYTLALTHTSFVKQNTTGKQETNERLEFLGDSILGAVVAEFLFKKFPYKDEGFLTEIRSRIVNRESLNNIAMRIGLNVLVKIDQKDHNSRFRSLTAML